MPKLIFLKNIESFQQTLEIKGLPSAHGKNEIFFLTLPQASSGLVQIENTPSPSAPLWKGRLYGPGLKHHEEQLRYSLTPERSERQLQGGGVGSQVNDRAGAPLFRA